jgi:hypothetical protein
MNKRTIALMAIVLFLVPFFSNAAIPIPNPGGYFNTASTFTKVVENVANFVLGFITVLGIIFIVYGGILYVTSAGDEGRAEEGKTTVTYAAIGLFLAAMAYAIEQLVLVTFTS